MEAAHCTGLAWRPGSCGCSEESRRESAQKAFPAARSLIYTVLRLNTKCVLQQPGGLQLSSQGLSGPTILTMLLLSKQLEYNNVPVSQCPYQALGHLKDHSPRPPLQVPTPFQAQAKPTVSRLLRQNWESGQFPAPTPDSQDLDL